MGASAKQASQMDYLLQRPSCVFLDPVVNDLLGDTGEAEGVHSKRVDGLLQRQEGQFDGWKSSR